MAIFSGQSFLITIHRTEQAWLTALQEKFEGNQAGQRGQGGARRRTLITQVLNAAVDTYLKPMESIEARIDAFEETVFGGQDSDRRRLLAGPA